MQHITLACVGELKESYFVDGMREYGKRLSGMCKFTVEEISPVTFAEKTASEKEIAIVLENEGKKLLKLLPKQAHVVVLCVEGKQLDSVAFAEFVADAAHISGGNLVFVIGSSHGLGDNILQRANVRLSLSKMTLPHQMARLVLTEQIYRAMMINANRTYHK